MLNSASYASVYYIDGNDTSHYVKIFMWLSNNLGAGNFDYGYDVKLALYKFGLHDKDTGVMLTLIFGKSL